MVERWVNEIKDALFRSVSQVRDVSIAFSGGLDSAILTHIVGWDITSPDVTSPDVTSPNVTRSNVSLYTACAPHTHDAKIAPEAAELLGFPLTLIDMSEEDVERALPSLIETINTTNPVEVSISIPLYFVARGTAERTIISGQGADELFGGYARYLQMDPVTLREEMERDYQRLLSIGVSRDHAIAHRFGKSLHTPYLDPKVVALANELPTPYKIRDGERKMILRDVGREIGLPQEIIDREKKAMQYSSGSMRLIRRLAKRAGLHLEGYLRSLG